MYIYIVIAFFLFFLAFFDFSFLGFDNSAQKRNIRKRILFFVGVVLSLFAGLRYQTGPDYDQYLEHFKMIKRIGDLYVLLFYPTVEGFFIEKGYVLVNYFFNPFHFNVFLIVFTSVTIVLKFAFFNRYSEFPLYTVALYFVINYLVQDFGQIRQGFAVGLLLWATHFIIERKPVKFLGIVLFASFFHFTAFIFLIAYFLPTVKIRYLYIFVLIITFQFFIKADGFTSIIASLIGMDALTYKLQYYANQSEVGITLGVILRVLLCLFLVLMEGEIKKSRSLHVFATLYLWGYLIFCLLSFNLILAGRLTIYFRFVEVLLIPNLLFLKKKNVQSYSLFAFIFLLYLGLQDYKQIKEASETDFYENYKTVFDEKANVTFN